MNKFSSFVVVACFLLVAGGCTGDDDGEAASEGEGYTSPLAEYLGFERVRWDPYSSRSAKIDSTIAVCMEAEGFEWTPTEPLVDLLAPDPEGLVYGTEEWVAKYGFGLSTQRFSQEQVGPDLLGNTWDFSPPVDPNQGYIDSLTEAEQEAYSLALYGDRDGPEITEDMTEQEANAAWQEWQNTSGCQKKSFYEVDGGAFGQAFEAEFGDELDGLEKSLEDDPRIVALIQKVGDCVADKGFQVDVEDVSSYFDERMAPLPESHLVELELDDSAKALLGEIQAEEIALATAVFDCGGEEFFTGQGSLYTEVRTDLEERFLEENRARIDTIRAEHES